MPVPAHRISPVHQARRPAVLWKALRGSGRGAASAGGDARAQDNEAAAQDQERHPSAEEDRHEADLRQGQGAGRRLALQPDPSAAHVSHSGGALEGDKNDLLWWADVMSCWL